MGKPEHYVEGYLTTQAKQHGFLCMKFLSSSTNGVPDRILIGHGHTIFVETKSLTGKLRRLQEETIKSMRNHGADVRVMNTRELVDEFFKNIRKE